MPARLRQFLWAFSLWANAINRQVSDSKMRPSCISHPMKVDIVIKASHGSFGLAYQVVLEQLMAI
jgi:hypothetical protein